MFELFVIALLQFANLSGNASTSTIGSSGWDVDAKSSTTSTIGSSGWDVDAAATSNATIGSSGWDVD